MTSLRIDDVHVSYGSGRTRVDALRGVSLRVRAGELVVIFGDPGAGKSTLMGCIVGAVTPDRGRVRVKGDLRIALARLDRGEPSTLTDGPPAVIVSDEPADGLHMRDQRAALDAMVAAVDAGHAVLVFTHSPKFHTAADRLFKLVDGRLVEWNPPASALRGAVVNRVPVVNAAHAERVGLALTTPDGKTWLQRIGRERTLGDVVIDATTPDVYRDLERRAETAFTRAFGPRTPGATRGGIGSRQFFEPGGRFLGGPELRFIKPARPAMTDARDLAAVKRS